jgi:seryl-tRNA synthetase
MQPDERRSLVVKIETARRRKNEIGALLSKASKEERMKLIEESASLVREIESLELELLPKVGEA